MSNNIGSVSINTATTSTILSGCITAAAANYSINYPSNIIPTVTSTANGTSLSVKGNANFEGGITIKGVDISKLFDDIQGRLAILIPDPAKLEKYEALKKAYDHYVLLEKLLNED